VLVLAFDTATPAVTVAVGDEEQVLAQRTVVDARRQGELLAVAFHTELAGDDRVHGLFLQSASSFRARRSAARAGRPAPGRPVGPTA